MPVQEHQRFDVRALEDYLRNHGFSGPLTVRQFKGGQSNPTYLISVGGERHAGPSSPCPAGGGPPLSHPVEPERAALPAPQRGGRTRRPAHPPCYGIDPM